MLPTYQWDKLGLVTCWGLPHRLAILCFDRPGTLRQTISQSLEDGTVEQYVSGPFSLHPFILLHVTTSFDTAL